MYVIDRDDVMRFLSAQQGIHSLDLDNQSLLDLDESDERDA